MCHVISGTDILFEKLTREIGGWNWKTTFAHNAIGAGDFLQSMSSFQIFLCPLDLSKYYSGSWRRYNLKDVYYCVDGDVAN